MNTVTNIALGVVALSGFLATFRVIRADSTNVDRMIGVDLLLTLVVIGVAVRAAATGTSHYLDLLLVASMLGFVSTISVGRFLERRNPK